MKKKLLLIAAMLLLILPAFAGCDLLGGGLGDGLFNQTGGTDDMTEHGNAKTYVNGMFEGSFSVTFKLTEYSSGQASTPKFIRTVRTADGYWIVTSDSKEVNAAGTSDDPYADGKLFIKKGTRYDEYTFNTTGKTFSKDSGDKSAETVETIAKNNLAYFSNYVDVTTTGKKGSDETIAGRSCATYTSGMNILGMAGMTNTYWIDKSTGVCMKYAFSATSNNEKSGTEVECVEFTAIGTITLPEYSSALPGDNDDDDDDDEGGEPVGGDEE